MASVASTDLKEPISILGVRHVQVLMLFLASLLCFSMRVNMSMAIVAMTDQTDENSFDWSIQTQGVILSAYIWGYVVLQVPGGELAARFGGMILVTLCVTINSVASLLTPVAGYYTNPGNWMRVFYLSSGVYIFSNTFFLIFGTSQRQKWNEPVGVNG